MSLTKGALVRICAGEEVPPSNMQVLGYKEIGRPGTERYRILLSDGKNSNSFSMLATQLNPMIHNGQLEQFTIIRVDKYVLKQIAGQIMRMVVILLEVSVVTPGEQVGQKLGNPQAMGGDGSTKVQNQNTNPNAGGAAQAVIKSSTSQLKSAISSSDNETVSYLLGKMDIKSVNMKEDGEAALHVACDKKNHDALDLLLSKTNIDVNVKDEIGQTPLYKSCKSNNLYAVGKLLDRSEINVNARENNTGFTPLHVACIHNNLQVVVKLLKSPRIKVNAKLPNGCTPLHCACMENIPVIVQKLLASPGIDVNARDAEGLTPIMDCVKYGSEDALKVLLGDTRVNLSIKDRDGRALEVEVRTSSCSELVRTSSCLELIKTERMRRDTEAVKQGFTSHAGIIAEETVPKEKMDTEAVNREKVDETALHVVRDKKNDQAQDLLLAKTAIENGKVNPELTNEAGSMAEVVASTSQLKFASSSKVKDETTLQVAGDKKNHEAQDLLLVKTVIENETIEPEAESITEVNLLNMAATSQLKSSISSKDKDGTTLDVVGNDKHEALDLMLAKTVIENREVGQEKTSWAGIIVRHNVMIEKLNNEIGMEEEKCKTNKDMRKQKMEDLARNHKEELSLLEKNQRHGIAALQDTLAKEERDEQRYIGRLKEHRDELAQELEKLTNAASSEKSQVQNVNNLLGQEIETAKKSEEQRGFLLEEENVQNQMNEVTKDKTEQKKEKKSKPFCSLASCPNKGRHKCSRCNAIYYCHQDCLSEDWPHHKMFCDYVYEANKVPHDFTSKKPLDIENTSFREEVE